MADLGERLKRRGVIAAIASVSGALLSRVFDTPRAHATHSVPDAQNALHLSVRNPAPTAATTELTATGSDPALQVSNSPGIAVYAISSVTNGSVGVRGEGPSIGVLGLNSGTGQGVGLRGGSAAGYGVLGSSVSGYGVYGSSDSGYAVTGVDAGSGVGLRGQTVSGIGAQGIAAGGWGIYGEASSGTAGRFVSSAGTAIIGIGPTAGHFQGAVVVQGSLSVSGVKSAVVPAANGKHQRVYCMESPESYFEDFGDAQLANGRAVVRIDPGFVSIVRTEGYAVFITEYGDSNGLYVSARRVNGFEVRERHGGTSSIQFGYRIVAKRRDIEGARLEPVAIPEQTPEPAVHRRSPSPPRPELMDPPNPKRAPDNAPRR